MIPPDSVFSQFVETSLRVSAMVAVLLILRPLLRRMIGSQWLCVVWLLVLGRLLVPVSIESSWSLGNLRELWFPGQSSEQQQSAVVSRQVESTTPDWKVRVTEQSRGVEASEPSGRGIAGGFGDVYGMLGLIWGVGVLIGLVGFAMRMRQTRNLAAQASPVTDPELLEVFENIDLKLRRGVELRMTSAVAVPTLAGLLRPEIWVPQSWLAQLSRDEMRHVLMHELGHARRRDLLVQRLFLVAQCLHWFNPFVWLAVRLAKADREMACDAWVLERESAEDLPEYGLTLLKVVKMLRAPVRVSPVLIEMAQSKSELSARVRAIGDFRQIGMWRGVIVLFAAVAGLAVGTTTTAQTKNAGQDATAALSAQIKGTQPATAGNAEVSGVNPLPNQQAKGSQVELKATVIEAPFSVWFDLHKNGVVDEKLFAGLGSYMREPSSSPEMPVILGRLREMPTVLGVLTEKQRIALIKGVLSTAIDVRNSTKVLATSGKPSVVGFPGNPETTRNLSVTAEIGPDENTIDLTLVPEWNGIRKVTTSVSVFSGQTVVLLSSRDLADKGRDKVLEAHGQLFLLTAKLVGNLPRPPKVHEPHVEVGAKFYELTDKAAQELDLNTLIQTSGANESPYLILTEPQRESFERTVDTMQRDVVTLMGGPRVTTKSNQRAIIEVIREVRYPANWEKDPEKPGSWTVTGYETRNAGMTLEVTPEVKPGEMIALDLHPQSVEALGFVDLETGKPAPGHRPRIRSLVADLWWKGADFKFDASPYQFIPGHRNTVVFSSRNAQQKLELKSGQAVVMILKETADTKPFEAEVPKQPLIAVITAKIIYPESM